MKDPTPEQLQRRREVAERVRLMQERGVKAPLSGTFGKGVPDEPKKPERKRGRGRRAV